MTYIDIEIQGITPLLCKKFTDEAAMQATNGTSISTVGDRGTPREIAESRLYIGRDGKPMIPNPNVFRLIIDAGKFFKVGRNKVTTQKSSMIPACLSIDQVECPILHKEPWCVDTRPVRIPSTGGRILTHRPIFNDWRLAFSCELEETLIGVKLFRDIIDAGGTRIGLGDFRPDCKGPYGKYKVVKWEVRGTPK